MKFIEDSDINVTRETNGGYLLAFSRVARSGVQYYRGAEVGVTQDTVALYRPPEEVFDVASIASYVGKPITLDHPWPAVDSRNWAQITKGFIGEGALRDGKYLRIPLAVMDAAAVEEVKSKRRNKLSTGYDMDIEWASGEDPETGEHYDGIQRNIRTNHVALCSAARAGEACRIGDEIIAHPLDIKPESLEKHKLIKDMDKTTVYDIGGVMIDSTERAVEELRKRDALIKELNEKISVKDSDLAQRDLAIDDLKKKVEDAKLSDEQISSMVKERAGLMSTARLIIGDKAANALKIESMAPAEIHAAVVHAAKGEAYTKDQSPEYIAAAFRFLGDSAHEAAAKQKAGSAGATGPGGSGSNTVVMAVNDGDHPVFPPGFRMPGADDSQDFVRDSFMARPNPGRDSSDDGQETYEQFLENAYRKKHNSIAAAK